jgi:hypothetical protein
LGNKLRVEETRLDSCDQAPDSSPSLTSDQFQSIPSPIVAEEIGVDISDQLAFNRKALEDAVFPGVIAPQPPSVSAGIITIDTTDLEGTKQDAVAADESFVPNGLDIVLWSPVFGSIAIQVLTQHLQLREEREKDAVNLGATGHDMHGEGSDIPIDVTVNSEDDSSSSSDETSLLSEHRAVNRGCSGHLRPITGSTLGGIFTPGASSSSQGQQQMQAPTFFKQIVIDTSTLFANQEKVHIPNGMEIVPWKPTGVALALQLFAMSVEYQGTEDQDQQGYLQSSASTFDHGFELEAQASRPSPITRVYKRRPKAKNGNMGLQQRPTGYSLGNFELQATQAHPSPPDSASQKAKRGHSRKTLSLPAPSNSSTPLVESSVRRSTRLNSVKEGFHFRTVRLDGEPSKKRKKPAVVLIDEATGQAGPIPIEILQSWGIDCGIAPAELSEHALLQAPASSSTVINE